MTNEAWSKPSSSVRPFFVRKQGETGQGLLDLRRPPGNPRYCRQARLLFSRLPGGLRSMTPDTFEMTQAERVTLVHDLRVAATHFDDDAARATKAGMRDIAQVLAHQAAEAREIADRLEDADYIRVGHGVE